MSWSTWAIHCEFAARPATTWPNGPGTWSQPWLPSYGFASLCNMRTKIAPDHEATAGLWGHLTALAIVILAFEAISLWRSDRQDGYGGSSRTRI